MAENLKPNKKFGHVYAILRYETDADPTAPVDLRVTVKKVVSDPHYAEAEVKRLNDLNQDKGSYYFCQITRFEDVPVDVRGVPPIPAGATKGAEV
jgi:hypothetical protein